MVLVITTSEVSFDFLTYLIEEMESVLKKKDKLRRFIFLKQQESYRKEECL